MKRVCIFAASSEAARATFGHVAAELGRLIAKDNIELVYGAGKVGLMGAVAEAVHAHGGRVIGVIPEKLDIPALTYTACDELIITKTMAERKATMAERADGFLVLPGGFGTLEELFEVLVLRQLGYHDKPIVFINTEGAFDGLMSYFAEMIELDLVKEDQCNLFDVAATPEAAMDALRHAVRPVVSGKWTSAEP